MKIENSEEFDPPESLAGSTPWQFAGVPRRSDGISEMITEMTNRAPRVPMPEMHRLIALAQAGDETMLNHLIEMNAALVPSSLKKIFNLVHSKGRHLHYCDFIQEGFDGLREAILRFDPKRGSFSNCATQWILQRARAANRDIEREVRFPGRVHEMLPRIHATQDRLTHSLGRAPTKQETAQAMNLASPVIERVLEFGRTHQKIDYAHEQDFSQECSILEQQTDHAAVCPIENSIFLSEHGNLQSHIAIAIQQLSEKEKQVLLKSFGFNGHDPKTNQEIAQELQVTSERIGQIKKTALKKLKKAWPQTEKEL